MLICYISGDALSYSFASVQCSTAFRATHPPMIMLCMKISVGELLLINVFRFETSQLLLCTKSSLPIRLCNTINFCCWNVLWHGLIGMPKPQREDATSVEMVKCWLLNPPKPPKEL